MSDKLNGMKVMRGTLSPETSTKLTKPKTAPKGRTCIVCTTRLSIYNSAETCFNHSSAVRPSGNVRRHQ